MSAHSHHQRVLINKLDAFTRKYYKNQLMRGAIYTVGLSFAFYLTVVLLEYYGHFGTLLRTVFFYFFFFSNACIIWNFILIPILKLYKMGKLISREQASVIIGNHFTEVKDKLLNLLQLQKISSHTASHSQLVEASINQKIKELTPIPFAAAVDFSQNKKYVKYALVPLLLFVFILFSAHGIIIDGTKRIVNHAAYFEKEVPFRFNILNKELKTIQQEDFVLEVKMTGNEIPEFVFVQMDGNEYKLSKENNVLFRYTFKNIQKSFFFRLAADGFYSTEYELTAFPNPLLLNFDIALDYPDYTGKKNEVVKNIGDLVVPQGTNVKWSFITQNTQQIKISFTDTILTILPSAENIFSYSARLMKNKNYSITTSNEHIRSKDSVVYAVKVIPDGFPEIQVEEKKDSVSSMRFYFRGAVKDDYGFSQLAFNYQFITGNDSAGSKMESQEKTISEHLTVTKSLTQDQFYYFWNLSELNVNAGDAIEYYFEVWDNDGVNGSKSARSQKMIYKAPTLRELADNTNKNNEETKADLNASISKAKELQKQIDALAKKLVDKKELGWEEKKKIEEMLNQQKELEKKVNEIKNENTLNNEQKQEFQNVDELWLEKQQQLQDMFDKLMTPEMKQMVGELQKMLEQMDKNKIQEQMEKMKDENKDLQKELDRALEMFKQLEFEQKLNEVIKNLDELAKKQDDLSQETEKKNSDSNELEKQQNDLNKEFENIQRDLDDLEKKNAGLEQPNKMENTGQKEQDITNEMNKSSEQLNKNQNNKAAKSQKNASQKMQEMSQHLAQMQQQMEQEQQEEDMNAMRELLNNLIQLSFDQEQLMKDFSKATSENSQYNKLIQEQKKLKDDAKMIEDSLLALSKRNFMIASTVNKEIGAVNNNMDKAIDNYTEAKGENIMQYRNQYMSKGASNQQYAMTSINNLALLMSEALNQMQQQMQSSMPNNSSCKKPGNCKKPGSGSKPSAATMRKLQQQLNKQIEELKEALSKGQKPGKNQGNSQGNGKQGMSEQLAKLAAQQEMLRSMMRQYEQDGNGKPGQSKSLQDKMEQTETDLVNRQITLETIRRQQEILTKLLDYEKSEKERERDPKRVSEEGKNENNRNLKEFFEYNTLKQREAELLKTVPAALNPYYKNKVTDYFNNFDR